jgi:hypothetical protein
MDALKVLCADAFWFCFFLVVVGVRLRVVGWCGNIFGGQGEVRNGNCLVFGGHFRSMNIPPRKEEGSYADSLRVRGNLIMFIGLRPFLL